MRPVFISYEKHDAGIANELCAYLERNGHACWIAPRDIVAGENYAGEIIRGVKGSGALIVVCSGFTKNSGHVLNEVSIAFDQKIQIIPYCVEDTHLGDNMDYYLAAIHRIISAGDRDADFKTILDTLENGRSVFTKKDSKKAHNHIGIAAALSAIIIAAAIGVAAGWFRSESMDGSSLPITDKTPVMHDSAVPDQADDQNVSPNREETVEPEHEKEQEELQAKVSEEVTATPTETEPEIQQDSPAVEDPVLKKESANEEIALTETAPEPAPDEETKAPEEMPRTLRESLADVKSLSELEGVADYYHVTINTSVQTLDESYLLICSRDGQIQFALSPQDASGNRINLRTGEKIDRIDYSKGDRVEYVRP